MKPLYILDIFIPVNLFMFSLGIISVVVLKRPSKFLMILLNIAKMIGGAVILILLLYKVSIYDLLGTGIDMLLSYLAGVLISSGILFKETDLL